MRGEMPFTPERMMRYIRSRARISTQEDLEDILQNALVMVTQHFNPEHPDANLALYCLGACNKAIAQNLERYHKVVLKKRAKDDKNKPAYNEIVPARKATIDGETMTVKTLAAGKSFNEEPAGSGPWRTISLCSMFAEDDGRHPDDVIGWEYDVLSAGGKDGDPARDALIANLVDLILFELPTELHRTCFLLKYVQGYKREDLIACLKMDARSIDTVDKKIVRTLKAFKQRLDKEESRI